MEPISKELIKTVAMILSKRDSCNYRYKGLVSLDDGMHLHFQDSIAGKGTTLLPKEINDILTNAVAHMQLSVTKPE